MKILINSAELKEELFSRSRTFNRIVHDKYSANSEGDSYIKFYRNETKLGCLSCKAFGTNLDWKFKNNRASDKFWKYIQSLPDQPLTIEFEKNIHVKAWHVFPAS